MKKTLGVLLIGCLGAALGRLFDGVPVTSAAGEGQGGAVEKCAPKNGDVNADGAVNLSDAVTILGNLFLGSPPELVPLCVPPPAPSELPNTGQTECYNEFGDQFPCNSGTCRGQDGFYSTGCPGENRFVDNGDGTVTDHCTGLMWQKDTADVNGDGIWTDQDYLTWCAALAYCEDLTFAGHDDWRLPNVRELQSIADYGRQGLSIDPAFVAFSTFYWSSTPSPNYLGFALVVGFFDGSVSTLNMRSIVLSVRAVRLALTR